MSFRTRLLILISLVVCLTAALVTGIAVARMRSAYETLDNERTAALVAQFRKEFQRRGVEVVQKVAAIAKADSVMQLAIALSHPESELSLYVEEAAGLAAMNNLDFLELMDGSGVILSSAHWPARFGYRAEWILQSPDWNLEGYFLKSEELPDETVLALVAVRMISAGDKKLYVAGGCRLGKEFLSSLVLQKGVRVLLYPNLTPEFSAQELIMDSKVVNEPEKLRPLIEQVMGSSAEASRTVAWNDGHETVHAIPLLGRDSTLLGMFLVGSSRQELLRLINKITLTGIIAAAAGILLGIALSYWVSLRITHPVKELVVGARRVAQGSWDARVNVSSRDEIGELAGAFNTMTQQLIDQRDRLVQAERVAAWRELARRLAHELKNPLFPLQITIENLQRAKERAPEQFEEVFRESTGTFLAQLSNLKSIVGRFSDFAKMPQPQIETVDLNELIRGTVQLFDAQFNAPDRPAIETDLNLDAGLSSIQADPEQIRRALQNLLLNAVDAMPQGGTITLRTHKEKDAILLEISDTGQGLTKEECSRLFTPYYTTKQHGTGLGLAIVQSVISDHGAKISVESEPGQGTTFRIKFSSR
ncbi:MAG: HAMP domain-containing protein [Acidobacteria bacterium]|nr:HAMP domain-containing protein [Acidobacteriota bacterium]